MITTVSLVMICHHERYCIVIDYLPHTLHFIPVSNLLCNEKFVCLNLPHWLLSSPYTPLSGNHLFVFHIYESFCFVMFVYLLDSTHEWIQVVIRFSIWFSSLSIIPSRSVHVVVTYGKISFCLWLIFHCVHVHTHLSLCVCVCVYYISVCVCVRMCMQCVQSLNRVWLFVTPWTVAHQVLLSMMFSCQE